MFAEKDKPNLQMGLLRRLLDDQIRTVQRTNLVQARKFSELLDEAINRYTNRSLTTAEIIAELVKLAKQMRDDAKRQDDLGLSAAEVALYDAIAQNDAAVLEMGDATLKKIAVDLVWAVRTSVYRLGSEGERPRLDALEGAASARQIRLPARR